MITLSGSLLHYRVIVLRYRSVTALSDVFTILPDTYYINWQLWHYRLKKTS